MKYAEARFGQFLTPNRRPYLLGETEDADLVGMRLYGDGPFHRERKPALQIRKKSHFVIRAGDIIYNKLFAWKGTFGVVPPDLDGMFVSDKFPTYEIDQTKIDPNYLRWYFKTPVLWDQAKALSKGAAALSKLTLNPPDFLKLTIPTPTSVEEQRRIVARIEALAGRIDEARELREAASDEANVIIKAARRGLIGECPSTTWIPLRTYVEEIENGWSPDCEKRRAEDGEWGVLKVGAVSFGRFDPQEHKALPRSHEPKPEFEIRCGDFLMSRANTTALAGACAIVKATRPRLMLCDKIFRFRFRESAAIDPAWLDHVLKSPALRTQIERGATGTSSTMKNISKGKVFELLVPPNSLKEQQRIVTELDALLVKSDTLRSLQSETAAELDALLPSILSEAFSGKL